MPSFEETEDAQRRRSSGTFQQPQYPPRRHSAVQFSPVDPSYSHCGGGSARDEPEYDGEGNVLPPAMAFALGPDWLTGLCDCTKDTESCMDTVFCPYCQLGYQYHRTRRSYVDMDAVVCLAACCGDMLAGGLGCTIATAFVRHKIVQRYRLDEGAGGLLIKGLCCAPLSVCQVHREMKLRGEAPGGVCIAGMGMNAPAAMPPMGGGSNVASRTVSPQGDEGGGGGVATTSHSPCEGADMHESATISRGGRPPVNPYYVHNALHATPTRPAPQVQASGAGARGVYASPTGILAPRFAPAASHFDHANLQQQQHQHRQSPGRDSGVSDPSSPALVHVGTPVYPETPLSVVPDTPATAAAHATSKTHTHSSQTP
eukprot:CAMPEP_0174832236 /NCGR_PEP_ID=MMETSP1114-20130205/3566_1 /TAXON_ID=312471 /ORGANISM="Neobodo designis, Strain CCAP 1951/1" /LENGTH=370 /DNA_ID=CAMNT_0016066091 /DNA_START=547 /DNA_END=1659 /DNA_ORIENTATION=-